jgi:outer membrane protein OmpA-like peptidoglycan-associated protein
VIFKGDEIAKSSANVLDQLATTLRARADITRLRITVHVQPTKSAKKDQALSDRRATAVQKWLVDKGIQPERIEVKGFGGTHPLVAPDSKGAAQINDRIEMIILERN